MLFVLRLLDYTERCKGCSWYHCHVATTILLIELKAYRQAYESKATEIRKDLN
jgi:hypothetical protein